MLIPLGTGDWSSITENFQRFLLHNMYLTDNPTTPDGVSRVSRPTLSEYTVIGSGPIYGMWRQENIFSGDWFVVSGEELYRYSETTQTASLLGDVTGSGYCQFSGISGRVIIVRDGIAFSTDGASIVEITIPDDLPVQSVTTINSYFILTIADSQLFYWIEPDQTDPDPLSFASVERIPDTIQSAHVISDELWFIGTSGPEVWSPTGDADAPFQRINGRVYSEGCDSRDTAINVVYNDAPAIMWVTDTKSVVVAQGDIRKISNESVEELLKTGTDLHAWFFRHNRHDFYVLTANEFTIVLDLIKNSWARWDTYLQNTWQAHVGLQNRTSAYAGDNITNQIWKLEEGIDDNGLPVIRECSGAIEALEDKMPCNIVYAKVNTGWSPSYGFTPQLELRWSDDQGNTWSDYYSASLGDRGEYNTSVLYRSLGYVKRPGRIFEFRFAEKARFRLDYATMNEVN